MLGADSADDKLVFFFICLENRMTLHANSQIVRSYFRGKKSKCHLLKCLPSMQYQDFWLLHKNFTCQWTLAMPNKLRCHAHYYFSANQITSSRLLIQIHILNVKQCRSWSVGFWRSQLIWIYTVCKGSISGFSRSRVNNFMGLSQLQT